ncbi:hypothetical protein V1478_011130 [Vespula squamosa]|uniref:Uncharacterized protein n=1 Tax=Vespula squamosa TaxID=30214 RepID=A0ABD2AGD4_VESSQ
MEGATVDLEATPLLVAVRTTSLVNDGTSSGNYFEVGTGSTGSISPTTMTTTTTLTAITTTIDDNDDATGDRAGARAAAVNPRSYD